MEQELDGKEKCKQGWKWNGCANEAHHKEVDQCHSTSRAICHTCLVGLIASSIEVDSSLNLATS